MESKVIQLGIACPDFSLVSTDGRTVTRDSLNSHSILIVGFTCNHCPYVQAYEDRLNELLKKYQSKSVGFVCINANDSEAYPEDSFEKMQERAKLKNFRFLYLWDESQDVARAFDAACTPEFYVFDSDRRLQYHGKLDDQHQEASAVQERFLDQAIEDLLAGRSPRKAQTHAIGCSIKWRKKAE